MGNLCCKAEPPSAPADRPKRAAEILARRPGPVRKLRMVPVGSAPPSGAGDSRAAGGAPARPPQQTGAVPAQEDYAALLAVLTCCGAVAAAVIRCDPSEGASAEVTPTASAAAPVPTMRPAEDAGAGARPALADLTNNPAAGQQLASKPPVEAAAPAAPPALAAASGADGGNAPQVQLTEGAGCGVRPALIDVTNNPTTGAACGQLASRPPEAAALAAPPAPAPAASAGGGYAPQAQLTGPASEEFLLRPPASTLGTPPLSEAPQPVRAPAAAPSPDGEMEEDGEGQCHSAAGSSSGANVFHGDLGCAGAVVGQRFSTDSGAGQAADAALSDRGPRSALADGAPCLTTCPEHRQQIPLGGVSARSQTVRQSVAAQSEQRPAVEQVLHAGCLEQTLLSEDARLPDEFFNAPPQPLAASVTDLRPAPRQAAAASADTGRCAAPASSVTSSSPRGGLPVRSVVPLLDCGPEGHLRVSEGSWVATRNGDEMHILSYLGSGSFAAVWRCSKRGSGVCALKICRGGAENLRCARREAAALRRVHERNPLRRYADRVLKLVFTVEVTGAHGVHLCIGMPQMGADVGVLLAAHGGLGIAPALAKALVKQTLQGLAYVAAAGYALTDLKPANLLLGASCRAGTPAGDALLRGRHGAPLPGESLGAALLRQYPVAIGDLGGCVDARQRGRQRLELTISYRAPEVVTGATRVTPAVGVWACACTCYEMVTGQRMFCPGRQESGGELDKVQWYQWYLTLGAPPTVYGLTARFEHARYFFTPQCKLRHCPRGRGTSVAQRLASSGSVQAMEQDELLQLADLLLRMLQYDPGERATPLEALRHPWLRSA
eukprot:TRINITY_DN20618_c0_g2_i1.p1 TRINITY_DN20618_c0_g2~~TRINITY_DN20618_c0_g2_i1.p1  ORF type:complete len:835 (+),score=189.79 TRINITY_DN20618_c0_g2_i1:60-2564(+)